MHRRATSCTRSRPGRTLARGILLLCLLLLCCPAPPAAADLNSLRQTPEWSRLVALWHTMLDHSSDLVYSPSRFTALVGDLDRTDADLTALAERGLLSEALARDLRTVVHGRYGYIRTRHYTTERRVSLTESEAAAAAARWLVERQLALIRAASRVERRDAETIASAKSQVAYELTFLHHLDRLEQEADRRRQELAEREEADEEVDWRAK